MEQKKEEMQPQTRAYTVEEIAAILHIGRSSAYTLVNAYTAPRVQYDRRRWCTGSARMVHPFR